MTRRARLLALSLFLAAPASSAPADQPPALIEAEFASRTQRAERLLAESRDIRLAFPEAADKDALAARWTVLEAEFGAWWRWEEAARSRHFQKTTDLRVHEVALGIDAVRRGGKPALKASTELQRLVDSDEAMRTRAEKLISAARDESALFLPVRESYYGRRAASRRRGVIAALSAGFLLACACVYAFFGPKSPPAQPRAPPPPAAGPAPGMVAGNYEVARLLGRGSVGEVYEAVDKTLQRRTALKRLRPELLGDPEGLEGMLKEARLMAGLKHPNLVAIYGVERDAGQVYLALECVDGETLEGRLRGRGVSPGPRPCACWRAPRRPSTTPMRERSSTATSSRPTSCSLQTAR